MNTKIYLTILVVLMSVKVASTQHIIYGDKKEANYLEKESQVDNENQTSEAANKYYRVDEAIPNTFTTGNNTKIVCHLLPGSDTNVLCSTIKPENGWGTMVSNDHNEYA